MFNDESPMPWGKYAGKPIGEVPDEYLLFLYESNKGRVWGEVGRYIEENIEAIKANVKRKQNGKKG